MTQMALRALASTSIEYTHFLKAKPCENDQGYYILTVWLHARVIFCISMDTK